MSFTIVIGLDGRWLVSVPVPGRKFPLSKTVAGSRSKAEDSARLLIDKWLEPARAQARKNSN
jgi:hypothetical protein